MSVTVLMRRSIFKPSLLKGTFASTWKEAAGIPIFEKGISSISTIYRPSSVLNNLAVENIVSDHI
jgi:hypothetical protein